MRDDFQIPNIGQAPEEYDVRFFSRMVRNVELALTALRAVGNIRVRIIEYQPMTVAGLPTMSRVGQTAYTSDGRKVGEGAGAGTGVLVFYDGIAWRACDSGQTVSA